MNHIVIDARIVNSSTGTYVQHLLKQLELIDTSNRYTVLTPSKDRDFYQPTNPNFTVVSCDVPNYSFAEQTTLKRQLDSLEPDLVHFCMPQQPIWYKGNAVTTFHDLTLLNTYNSDKNKLVFTIKQIVGRYVFKKALQKNSFILAPTEYTKQDILTTFPDVISPDDIIVTYEAAEQPSTKLRPYDVPFKQFLLYVGQQSDYKNIRRLGDAHQKLLQMYPDLGLVLVGKKNDSIRANEAYFADRGYKNIHFTDFIDNDQRDWLYTKTAAYVFPSLMEGFGLPGLEAMTYGAPVVSSNATCLPEVYQDGAHYFDPTDSNDMAQKISDVLDSSSLRQQLIQRGHEVAASYSWSRMAQQTLEVYTRALNQAQPTKKPEK